MRSINQKNNVPAFLEIHQDLWIPWGLLHPWEIKCNNIKKQIDREYNSEWQLIYQNVLKHVGTRLLCFTYQWIYLDIINVILLRITKAIYSWCWDYLFAIFSRCTMHSVPTILALRFKNVIQLVIKKNPITKLFRNQSKIRKTRRWTLKP